MEKIALENIVSEDNRKHTKDDGFEQLANSIRKVGILEPPIVRRLGAGQYRVITGRRRVAAARHIGLEEIECIVKEPGDKIKDETIALLENVNRLEMHPLDEAEAFSRMAAAGHTAEGIAQYYARSPSAIYKRVRLAALADGLKTMFREGLLNISGAAALAELPEEDQEEFFEGHKYLLEAAGGEPREIDISAITGFIYKKQKMRLRPCMGGGCEGCAKRTHNRGNSLFEEYAHMNDVCLDGECYGRKWREIIGRALAEKAAEHGGKTDLKVRFHSEFQYGIPESLYKKATHVEFDLGDGEGTRFEVLRGKGWDFTGETKRKNGACWEIGETWGRDGVGLRVRRVGYEERKPEERAATGAKGDSGSQCIDQIFGKENAAAVAAERGMQPAELENAFAKKTNIWEFTNETKDRVFKRITAERVKEKTPFDYFGVYLKLYGIKEDGFTSEEKKLFHELTGKKTIKDIEIPGEIQQLFHFLLIQEDNGHETLQNCVPDFDDFIRDNMSVDERVFVEEYAGMGKEAYTNLWAECAREAMDECLKPKGKPAKKKGKQQKAPAAGETPGDTEDPDTEAADAESGEA